MKLEVGLIFISSLGKKSAYVSVFERMTYTIYPPPSNYFFTLSKIKESWFFSWRPPAFSDDVILYDVFSFWRRFLSTCWYVQVHPDKDLQLGQCSSDPGREQVRHGGREGDLLREGEATGGQSGAGVLRNISKRKHKCSGEYFVTQRCFSSLINFTNWTLSFYWKSKNRCLLCIFLRKWVDVNSTFHPNYRKK